VLVAAVVAIASGCRQQKVFDAPVQTVRAGVVEEITPDVSERYSVTIQPFRQVDLAFKSPGVVDRVLQVRGADGRMRDVQAGDRVPEGAELARVRSTDYEQRRDQAHAAVRQAEAQIAQLDAQLKQAQSDAERASRLFASQSITKPDYEQAQARFDATKAQADAARASLANATAGQDEAALALSDATIHAPFTGWVAARTVEPGGLAGNTSVAFTLIDTHAVKAAFAVPDTSLGGVKTGQHVSVWLEALSARVTGTVTSVAPQADQRTHVYSVDVTIDNANEQIRPGMVGSLVVGPATATTRRLVVPLSAIVRDPANASGVAVFRIEDRGGQTVAVVQAVATGDTFGNTIEITSGLNAGDRVVSLGGELLRSGDQVRVLR
jgi:multidrug efflux system membrane fusion protein